MKGKTMIKRFLIPVTFLIALFLALLFLPGPAPATETGTLTFRIVNKLTGSGTLSAGADTLNYNKEWKLTDGTGALKAESVFHDSRTLTASANEELDLSGTLTDAFGASITFTKIKAIAIYAASANTNNVLVGGSLTNAFINWVSDATDKLIVQPNGMFFLMNPTSGGYGVTPATGDLLKIENSGAGTSVTYEIIIIGETT